MTPNEGDFGETELDPAERAQADLDLDDPESSDNEPWSPPTRQPRGAEGIGEEGHETIDQRIRQEEPELGSAYGDPDDADTRPQRMAGGDDPDAIPLEDDFEGMPDDVALDDER